MKHITKEQLVEADGNLVEKCEKKIKSILSSGADFAVLEFRKSDKELRELFSWNGGDEDWMVLTKKKNVELSFIPYWILNMDSCQDPDCYELSDYIVFVGSHA